MRINVEDGGKILVTDLPKWNEYSQIILNAEKAGECFHADFKKFTELRNQITFEMEHLLANCIARGARLAKEGKY